MNDKIHHIKFMHDTPSGVDTLEFKKWLQEYDDDLYEKFEDFGLKNRNYYECSYNLSLIHI